MLLPLLLLCSPAASPALTAAPRRSFVLGSSCGALLAGAAGRRAAARERAASALRSSVAAAVADDPALAGTLLRLAFHDATRRDGARGGADGSIRFELADAENVRLGPPLARVLELRRPVAADLSVADAVAVAGAAAVEAAGGPAIRIGLGRRDAAKATPPTLRRKIERPGDESRDVVTATMPQPGLSTVGVRRYFRRPGLALSDQEIVALMGAHTLGRHNSLLNMTKGCLRNLTRECLEAAPVRLPFANPDPDRFSSTYFRRLLEWDARRLERGDANLIPTDVTLVLDPGFRRHVEAFARSEPLFRACFARAYAKLVR